mgnify:CR=1 FL=1
MRLFSRLYPALDHPNPKGITMSKIADHLDTEYNYSEEQVNSTVRSLSGKETYNETVVNDKQMEDLLYLIYGEDS